MVTCYTGIKTDKSGLTSGRLARQASSPAQGQPSLASLRQVPKPDPIREAQETRCSDWSGTSHEPAHGEGGERPRGLQAGEGVLPPSKGIKQKSEEGKFKTTMLT